MTTSSVSGISESQLQKMAAEIHQEISGGS